MMISTTMMLMMMMTMTTMLIYDDVGKKMVRRINKNTRGHRYGEKLK